MPKTQKQFKAGDFCWIEWDDDIICVKVIVASGGIYRLLKPDSNVIDNYTLEQMFNTPNQAQAAIRKRLESKIRAALSKYNRFAEKSRIPYLCVIERYRKEYLDELDERHAALNQSM